MQQKGGLWYPFQSSFPNPVAIRQKPQKWSRWKIRLHCYSSHMGPNTHGSFPSPYVLPDGFMRIRHFGFLANRSKKKDLGRCRELLGLCPELPKPSKKTTQELMLQLTGIDVTRCPFCKKGTMKVVGKIPEFSGSLFNASFSKPKIKDSS